MDFVQTLFNRNLSVKARRMLLKESAIDEKGFNQLLYILLNRLDFKQAKTRRLFTSLLARKHDPTARSRFISTPQRFNQIFDGNGSTNSTDGRDNRAGVQEIDLAPQHPEPEQQPSPQQQSSQQEQQRYPAQVYYDV